MSNKLDIEKRRRVVWDLYLQGVPQQTIAETYGVHRNTIANDVKVLKKRHRDEVDNCEAKTEIGDLVAKYDHIFTLSMRDYQQAQTETAKNNMLSRAMAALEKKSKLLTETGVIPKAAQEVNGVFRVEGVDVKNASIEELHSLRNRLQSRLSTADMQ